LLTSASPSPLSFFHRQLSSAFVSCCHRRPLPRGRAPLIHGPRPHHGRRSPPPGRMPAPRPGCTGLHGFAPVVADTRKGRRSRGGADREPLESTGAAQAGGCHAPAAALRVCCRPKRRAHRVGGWPIFSNFVGITWFPPASSSGDPPSAAAVATAVSGSRGPFSGDGRHTDAGVYHREDALLELLCPQPRTRKGSSCGSYRRYTRNSV
jgi:hypothetical protein